MRPLWGSLVPGPYPIGFTTSFALDHDRTYDLPPVGPRPILINVWYPAQWKLDDPIMRQRQYLEIETAPDSLLGAFSRRLAEANSQCVMEEIGGRPPEELDAAHQDIVNQFLQTPTAAVRNADAAEGSFPLLLIHQGYGGTFVDNTVLFEFLASHGYVVANSAYQSADDSTLGIDHDPERSIKDLNFLLQHMQSHPQVDAERIAIIGYSYGAQTALTWLTKAEPPIQALVSLDTTLEYCEPEEAHFEGGYRVNISLRDVRLAIEGAPHVAVPVLIFTQARISPDFTLYEKLPHSERYYAQVKSVGHFHFVSLSVLASEMRPQDIEGFGLGSAPEIRESYEQICSSVLVFLNTYLKNDGQALGLLREMSKAPTDGDKGASQIIWRHQPAAPLPSETTIAVANIDTTL